MFSKREFHSGCVRNCEDFSRKVFDLASGTVRVSLIVLDSSFWDSESEFNSTRFELLGQ